MRLAGDTAANRPRLGMAFWLCVGVALAVLGAALIAHRLDERNDDHGSAEAKLGASPLALPVTPGTLTKLRRPVVFKKVACAPGPLSSEEACFWAPHAVFLGNSIESNDGAMRLLVTRFGAKPIERGGLRPLVCTRAKRYPARGTTFLHGRTFLSCHGLAILGPDLLGFKLMTATVDDPKLRGSSSGIPYVRLGTDVDVLDVGTLKSVLNQQREFKREEGVMRSRPWSGGRSARRRSFGSRAM
jgi:hypothetical protein